MASATVDGELIEEVSEMTKSLSLSNGILNTSNSDLTDVESGETEFDADIKKRGPGKIYRYLESHASYEDAVESLKLLDPLKDYKWKKLKTSKGRKVGHKYWYNCIENSCQASVCINKLCDAFVDDVVWTYKISVFILTIHSNFRMSP